MRHRLFARGVPASVLVRTVCCCAVAAPLALGGLACSAILDVSAYHTTEAAAPTRTDDGGEPEASPPPSCASTAECVQKNGEYSICRKSDHVCVSLQSKDCTRVFGDYKNDNAIFLGSLLPLAGPDQTTGIPCQNAIELAIDDFKKAGNIPPRPGSTERRPLVLIGCNDASEDETAVRAARHLANDVQVPAIIGAAFSGITIKVATDVTIPAKVLLMSPSATSVAITRLDDKDLVWRTSPSDVIQADAHAAFMPAVEAEILKRGTVAPGSVKVAVVHKGDTYGSGLAQALVEKVVFNGKPAINPANSAFLKVIDYGDPADTAKPPDYARAVQETVAFRPQVVYLFGTTESVTEVLAKIESEWPLGVERPTYLLADGAFISDTWAYLQAEDFPADEKRKRIFGTVPGTNNANYQTFRILYGSTIRDGTSADTSGTANAYDALYNLAYAAVAIGDKPLTGPNLVAGFARQVPPGTAVKVGATNINTALQHLLGGGSIDFDGASGPLDYDLATGEASSDIQFWCMPKGVDGKAAAAKNSSTFYNAATKTIEGTLAEARAACGM
jgi:branched-chain amino acid transport system substrate-binding protein